jgi:ketosteroid isomerase-like protein
LRLGSTSTTSTPGTRSGRSPGPARALRLEAVGLREKAMSRESVRGSTPPRLSSQRRPILDRLALRYPGALRACFALTMSLPPSRLRNGVISAFVQRGYEAFNRGDMEAASAGFASDIEYEVPQELPDSGVVRGRQAVIKSWEKLREDFGDVRTEPPKLLSATRDAIVVRLVIRAEGLSTGIGGELRGTEVFRVRGGRIVSARNYMNESKALEAVGLRE